MYHAGSKKQSDLGSSGSTFMTSQAELGEDPMKERVLSETPIETWSPTRMVGIGDEVDSPPKQASPEDLVGVLTSVPGEWELFCPKFNCAHFLSILSFILYVHCFRCCLSIVT